LSDFIGIIPAITGKSGVGYEGEGDCICSTNILLDQQFILSFQAIFQLKIRKETKKQLTLI
jgi:hypothetical protein